MRRTIPLYTKEFKAPVWDSNIEEVYLEFQGIAVGTDIWLNGVPLSYVNGGYASFRVNVSKIMQAENCLKYSDDKSVYRNVNMIVVNKYHFDMDYFGGSGMRITSQMTSEDAEVRVKSWNNAPSAQVFISILDKTGNTVIAGKGTDTILKIEKAVLWDGVRNPYLYTVILQLYMDGQVVDQVHSRFGIRQFQVDSEKGFFLNGHKYDLKCAVRYEKSGNAGEFLTKEQHRNDIELLISEGINMVRLEGHQNDQYFYELCDEYGVLVWSEFSEGISEGAAACGEEKVSGRYGESMLEQNKLKLRELIIQNYNRPSVIVWGWQDKGKFSYSNRKEVLLYHQKLNALCRSLDDTRLTAVSCAADIWMFSEIRRVSDITVGETLFSHLHNLWVKILKKVYPNYLLYFLKTDNNKDKRIRMTAITFLNTKKEDKAV